MIGGIGPGRVERAGDPALAELEQPGAEVAHVDELHLAALPPRREHLAAAGDPARPVGEAAGRVVRADDQAGADAGAAAGEDLGHDLLAERLEAAVAVTLEALVRGVVEADQRRLVLARGLAEVAVDRDARDEGVVPDAVGEQLGRLAHDARQVARGIDHDVPVAALERREVAVAVAAQLLDVGKELRVGLAAVEQRHLVPARERLVDDRATEELRPAEDQHPHRQKYGDAVKRGTKRKE